MVESIDLNNDGKVDFEEFAQVWWAREKASAEVDWDTELEFAFQMLNADGDGQVSVQELRRMLTTTGNALSDEEVEELLRECDLDADGALTRAEFKGMKCWRSNEALKVSRLPGETEIDYDTN